MRRDRRAAKLATALLLGASAAWPRAAAADPAYLVADINRTSGGTGSDPKGMLRVGDVVYFAATEGDHGRELWKTDGTEAGTVLVADIAPGAASSNPYGLTALHETLYFFADDGQHGVGLWRSNGTKTGTKLVRALPGATPFGDGRMRAAGDVLFFLVKNAGDDLGLWRTDGTPEGTQAVMDHAPGPTGTAWPQTALVDPVALGNALLFMVYEETTEKAYLWRTLGTPQSTTLLKAADPGALGQGWAISYLTRVGDTVFFRANDAGQEALWKTDGTAGGTALVRTLDVQAYGLAEAQGKLLFTSSCSTEPLGFCLWTSDGTTAGTHRVLDVTVATPYDRSAFVASGGAIFFEGSSPHGLWKTDGTAPGTQYVQSVATSMPGVAELVDRNGTLIFTADKYASPGVGLWRSDGTAGGTVRIDAGATSPIGLTALGGNVLFQASDDAHGKELWRTDGTDAGTRLVRDVEPSGQTADPKLLTDANGVLFFVADDGEHGAELWKSDGTAKGTTLVADMTPGPGSTSIDWLAAIDSAVLIGLTNEANEAELWRSDDTGLHQLWSFGASASTGLTLGSLLPKPLGQVGGAVYLVVSYSVEPYHRQLWRCDGSAPSLVQEVSGSIFVSATDGADVYFSEVGSPNALWRTDGTSAGTSRLAEFPEPVLSIAAAGGRVFFGTGADLWVADATSSAPTRVAELVGSVSEFPLAALKSEVFGFVSSPAVAGDPIWSLWKSDGTPEGTVRVAKLPGVPDYDLVASAGTLFFSVAKPAGQSSLWISDGTAEGTRAVRDLPQSPAELAPLPGGSVIFATGDTSIDGFGVEPWISDGTTDGTYQLQEIGAQARSSSPAGFTLSGERVFFSADDGIHGRELWALPWSDKPSAQNGCACALPTRKQGSATAPLLSITAIAIAAIRRAARPRAATKRRGR